MKLHGWCQTCQRVRRVTVRTIARSMPVGICDECAEEPALATRPQ